MRDLGCIQSPQHAFILNLGLESLHVRMPRHVENGLAVAEFLQKRIKDVMADKSEKYKNCDIMYSYEVEGVSDEKNSYSR